jgi:hypothetical protein
MKIVKQQANLEIEESEEREYKVSMEFILKLRKEAKRQKLTKDAKTFAKMLGNDGKDIPEIDQESKVELDKIANSFEITEE